MKCRSELKMASFYQRKAERMLAVMEPERRKYFQLLQDGKRALPLTSDVVFKRVMDPDVHPERLSRFLSLIFGYEIEVLGSSKYEVVKDAFLDKGIIMDIHGRIKGGGSIVVEMQVARQEFADKRIAVTSAAALKAQYNAHRSIKDLKKVFSVFIMVNSPKSFKDTTESIHLYRQRSQTGPELELLQEYVFVELKRYLKEDIPLETEEDAWLGIMASESSEVRRCIIRRYPYFEDIEKEVQSMLKSPRLRYWMMRKDMEDIIRKDERQQDREEGLEEGREIGLELGREKGREEGREEGRMEILLKIIKEGLLTDETIERYANELGYTLEQVKNMTKK